MSRGPGAAARVLLLLKLQSYRPRCWHALIIWSFQFELIECIMNSWIYSIVRVHIICFSTLCLWLMCVITERIERKNGFGFFCAYHNWTAIFPLKQTVSRTNCEQVCASFEIPFVGGKSALAELQEPLNFQPFSILVRFLIFIGVPDQATISKHSSVCAFDDRNAPHRRLLRNM